MKDKFKKLWEFIKENGHKMFTFAVGLSFIIAVCCVVGLAANRIYRVFVPTDIYADSGYAKSLYGGSVYETDPDTQFEEASADFFENYIGNFIKQDMPDFEDPLDLNDEYMISYGLWQGITLNNAQGVYNYDKKGNFRIPASDVEMYLQYCFDFSRKIEHRDVKVCGEFDYNMLNKTYKIGASGVHSYLIPDVIEVAEGENDTYVLTVDCYDMNMMSSADPKNDPINLRKRVKITMQDMGIQNYNAATGTPVHRYMFLSMDTQEDKGDKQVVEDVDLN